MNTITEPKTNEQELRELDAWIAETIFHWHKVETGDNKSLCSVCGNGFGARHKHYIPDFHSSTTGSVPFYTTDPAAAMQVLEKCAEKMSYSNGIVIGKHPSESIWLIESKEDKTSEVSASTLPLAICLFAKQLFGE